MTNFSMPVLNPDKVSNHDADCKHCGTTISSSVKATSNFRRHRKRKHPDVYSSLDTPAPVSLPSVFKMLAEVKHELPSSPALSGQPLAETFAVNICKWKPSDQRQKQLENAIASMISHDLLPMCFLDSKKF